jgi:Ger(x)C family germination protein
MAVGIDLANEGKKPGEKAEVRRVETFVQEQGGKDYRLSLQLLRLTATTGTQGETASEPSKTFVISDTGSSLFEMERDMFGQSSKSLYFEHLNAIVISENAVKKNGLQPLLDFFLRDSEMRWRIKVFITPGEARPILEFVPPTGEPGGKYLTEIISNHRKGSHLAGARTDLGYISQALDNGLDVMIPRIEMADKVIKVGGLAAFKHDQFIGYVDEYVVRGIKMIVGTEKAFLITVECPQHPGNTLSFEIFHHDTVLTPHVEGNNVYFTLDIFMQGNLGEVTCAGKHDTRDFAYLRTAERLFADEVKRNAEFTLSELQRLQVDSLQLGAMVKGDYPDFWAQYGERWDDIYPTIPMIISVNVVIRDIGEHR